MRDELARLKSILWIPTFALLTAALAIGFGHSGRQPRFTRSLSDPTPSGALVYAYGAGVGPNRRIYPSQSSNNRNEGLSRETIPTSTSTETSTPTSTGTATGTATVTATATTGGVSTPTLTPTVTATRFRANVYLPSVTLNFMPPFTDDFSNPNSGWPIDQTDIYQRDYLNGEYEILVKQAGYIVYAGHDLLATDFQAAVDASSNTPTNGTYGLYFGSSTAGRYVFDVSPSSTTFQLLRRDVLTGTWVALIPPTPSSAILSGKATNRLKVTRQGEAITLYVNGQQLSQYSDNTLGQGYVGLEANSFTANQEALFDNFIFSTSPSLTVTSRNVTKTAAQAILSQPVGSEGSPDAPSPPSGTPVAG